MKKRIFGFLSVLLMIAMIVTGCSKAVSNSNNSTTGSGASTEAMVGDTSAEDSENGTESTDQGEVTATTVSTTSEIVVDKEFTAKDLEVGYEDTTATHITLNQNSIEVFGDGATADGSVLTISNEGSYVISGTLTDGQIIIDAGDSDKVQLVLNGVSISCQNSAPIYVKNADKVFITLKDGSQNLLTDGTEYNQTDENTVDGVIFSKSDLTLNGTGSLSITANYKHGIVSKDDLVITGGSYTIQAVKAALNGKNSVKIKDGAFTLSSSEGDGIQSKNDEDTTKGYVYISGGTITIKECIEGIEGTFILVEGGDIDITASDDGFNAASGMSTTTNDSQTNLSTMSTAVVTTTSEETNTSEANISLSNLSTSDEAAASSVISLSNTSSETDAVSSATTSDQSGRKAPGNAPANGDERPADLPQDGMPQGDSQQGNNFGGGMDDPFAVDENCFIQITGGTIHINALGDGIDSNGSLAISGGTIYVSGPTENNNGSLDYNGTAEITGGVVVAAGSSGMAQSFSDTSSQCSLLYNLTTVCESGTELTLTDADGNVIVAFTPDKEYQSVVISAPELVQGNTYQLTCGDQTNEITLSSVSTSNGQQSMGGMPGGRGGQGRGF